MTNQWSVPAWAAASTVGVLVLLLLVAVFVAWRGRSRARRAAAGAEASAAQLRARLEALEQGLDSLGERGAEAGGVRRGRGVAHTEQQFVITSLGGEPTGQRPGSVPAPALPAPAFADAVLRDTVVHAAALVHGVRRALSPEVRNRIRFEMGREMKRTRKERRVEVKEALREYRARHRAEVPDDGSEETLRDGAA